MSDLKDGVVSRRYSSRSPVRRRLGISSTHLIGMIQNFAQIWRFRYFWLSLVKMDLQLRYRRSFLGIGWSLLHPIAMTVVFCFIFSNWWGASDWRADAPYFLAGLAIWELISGSILQGCDTFSRNEAFIRQCPLPMGIYPLRTVLGTMVHFMITLGVVIVAIMILTPTGLGVFGILWAVIPSLLLMFLFCWAVSVLAGFLNVFFEDTKHILEVLFRMFFFLTPILYKYELLVQKQMQWLADYNPIVLFFDLIRAPLLSGEPPDWYLYRNAILLVIATVAMALMTIKWLEKKLIFHL